MITKTISVWFLALFASSATAQNHTTFNTRGIAYPAFRYVPWDDLSPSTVADAEILGYTNVSWNNPGSNFLEALAYDAIEARSNATNTTGTKSQFEALIDIGFDNETVYDCYVNHYEDFFWEELSPDAMEAFEGLGWNVSSWNELVPFPPSEYKFFAELSPSEQQSAVELCYLPELWDEISLTEWTVDYASLAEEWEQEMALAVMRSGERDLMEDNEIEVDQDAELNEASSASVKITIDIIAGVMAVQSTILLFSSLMW